MSKWATPTLISAVILLALLGFARIYTVQVELQKQQAQTCRLRHSGRASENQHVRVPLKGALAYLGSVVLAEEKARPNPDPVKHQQAIDFANKYLGYAAAIRLLPNPDC